MAQVELHQAGERVEGVAVDREETLQAERNSVGGMGGVAVEAWWWRGTTNDGGAGYDSDGDGGPTRAVENVLTSRWSTSDCTRSGCHPEAPATP